MSDASQFEALFAHVLRAAVPYGCAALGGVWSERSGIANIALEGVLLTGAFGGIVGELSTGSAALGVAAGVVTGALFACAHGVLSARYRIDAIVSGLAINLMALGGTRVALRALYRSSSNSPSTSHLSHGLLDPYVAATLLLAVVTMFVFERTRFGLRLRAAGEDPAAARAVGIQVEWTRIRAVTIGGAICALGGVALAAEQGQFQSGMSGGRGFIALTAVILGGWRPVPAVALCLLFSIFDTAQIALQGAFQIPPNAVQALPFVVTLVALGVAGALRRKGEGGRVPLGIGLHAD